MSIASFFKIFFFFFFNSGYGLVYFHLLTDWILSIVSLKPLISAQP